MKDFAMFTPAGEAAVAAIVETAIENSRGFGWVYNELMKLSEVSIFREASDTAVREACYIALEEAELV
jgi:hypothetical protein